MNTIFTKTSILLLFIASIYACGSGNTFKDQIIEDVSSKMGTGICDSIPMASNITNVVVGEIVDIGGTGMTDVTIEFDYENNGDRKHHKGAILYIKEGSRYKLAALGGCEYDMK